MPLAVAACLTARKRERSVREHGDLVELTLRGELGEREREEVVAGRLRRLGPVRRPGSGAAASHHRAVDDVVVDERRHVDELDRHPLGDGQGRVRRGREEREQRAESLATGGERIRATSATAPG